VVKCRKLADRVKRVVQKRESFSASLHDRNVREIAGGTTLLKKSSDGFDTAHKDAGERVAELAKAAARGSPNVENTLNMEKAEDGVDKVL